MDISDILSNYTTGLSGILPGQAVSRANDGAGKSAEQYTNPRAQGDRVSISEEARALFARKLQYLRTEDEPQAALALGRDAQTQAALALGTDKDKAEPAGGEKIHGSERHPGAASPNALPSTTGPAGDSADADTHAAADGEEEKNGLGAAGGGGGSGSANSTEAIDELQAKINEITNQLQQLNTQLMGIMGGPGSPEEKTQQAAPVQAKIQQLEGQLNELRNQLLQLQKNQPAA